MTKIKILGIIPARYASTRFPGKPLALVSGKPMIERVWEGIADIPTIDKAIVATDDERIAQVVQSFGGCVMMTSPNHRSGTDRCGEVLQQLGNDAKQYDVVINIQGDEPRVSAKQIAAVVAAFEQADTKIATLKKRITHSDELFNSNVVKVTTDLQGNALCFSRSPLPFLRGQKQQQWVSLYPYFKHIGIYAFRRATLQHLVQLSPTPIEQAESLEQMRWLEHRLTITVRETDEENIAIDTPTDLARLNAMMNTTVD